MTRNESGVFVCKAAGHKYTRDKEGNFHTVK